MQKKISGGLELGCSVAVKPVSGLTACSVPEFVDNLLIYRQPQMSLSACRNTYFTFISSASHWACVSLAEVVQC